MTESLDIIYISLSGNTDIFVKRLAHHLTDINQASSGMQLVNVKFVDDFYTVTRPFIAILPTYLKGGNGTDNGFEEILTDKLRHFLAYHDNYRLCQGIIGSGNRNFNKQFALTAKQYAEQFSFPVLDEFELRGNKYDIERITNTIINLKQTN